jgi:hypothetical protein
MPITTSEFLVAQPGLGSIFLVQPQADGTAIVSALIEDLHNPQGMALHQGDASVHKNPGNEQTLWHHSDKLVIIEIIVFSVQLSAFVSILWVSATLAGENRRRSEAPRPAIRAVIND